MFWQLFTNWARLKSHLYSYNGKMSNFISTFIIMNLPIVIEIYINTICFPVAIMENRNTSDNNLYATTTIIVYYFLRSFPKTETYAHAFSLNILMFITNRFIIIMNNNFNHILFWTFPSLFCIAKMNERALYKCIEITKVCIDNYNCN